MPRSGQLDRLSRASQTRDSGGLVDARRGRGLGVAITLCIALLVSACGVLAPRGAATAGSSLDDDYAAVQSAISDYLSGATQQLLQTDPDKFFSEGHRLLGVVQERADAFSAAISSANLPAESSPGYPSRTLVETYATALNEWVVAQQEQASMSEQCWKTVDREGCYKAMLASNGARWQSTADRMNSAQKALAEWSTKK